MKIALAQLHSLPGQLEYNGQQHHAFIESAAGAGADLVAFPELSLTGYEPTLAEALAFAPDSPELDGFQRLSDRHKITICLGLPLRNARGITISMGIFQPERARRFYAKRYLHEDEQAFFVPGNEHGVFTVQGRRIAPAICYELFVPEHAAGVLNGNVDVYLGSVAKSSGGVARAHQHLPTLASNYQLPVLMVNGLGPADNFVAAGGTAAWDETGKCLRVLKDEEGILLIDFFEP